MRKKINLLHDAKESKLDLLISTERWIESCWFGSGKSKKDDKSAISSCHTSVKRCRSIHNRLCGRVKLKAIWIKLLIIKTGFIETIPVNTSIYTTYQKLRQTLKEHAMLNLFRLNSHNNFPVYYNWIKNHLAYAQMLVFIFSLKSVVVPIWLAYLTTYCVKN